MDTTQPATPPVQQSENIPVQSSAPVSSPESQSTPPQSPSSSAPPPTPVVESPTNDSPPPKKRNFLAVLAFFVLFIGFALLALWYYQTSMKKDVEVAVKPSPIEQSLPQSFVIGTDPTYPPMEYLEANQLAGYDIDLANFIGKELNVQMKFKNMVFDDLFPALERGDIDMIISTVTVSEERKELFDFSEPYLQAGQVILTQSTNTTITDTTKLQGKKIGVQKGTTIETEALKYTSNDLVIRYPDFVAATSALVKGEVDAIFADLPGAKGIVNENPTLKIASDPFTTEYYAIVFRKKNPQIAKINEALTSLRVKGILTELNQKWLDK